MQPHCLRGSDDQTFRNIRVYNTAKKPTSVDCSYRNKCLAFLEHEQAMHWEEITENDDWIDDFQPPPEVADAIARVRAMEIRLKEIEVKLYMAGIK